MTSRIRKQHTQGIEMSTKTQVSRILVYEIIGFLTIIGLSWINETELSQLFGESQYVPNWRESARETLIILLTAIPVLILTKRLASRLYHLEGFLRVCAWCRKLEHNGEWLPLEGFFENKFQTQTSHGMCAACKDEEQAKRKKQLAA
jgi:hypothetical protein